MKNCESCKYWQREGKKQYGECDFADDNKEPSKRFEVEVNCDDDSGMNISLKTGEYFGCIHHKEKQS